MAGKVGKTCSLKAALFPTPALTVQFKGSTDLVRSILSAEASSPSGLSGMPCYPERQTTFNLRPATGMLTAHYSRREVLSNAEDRSTRYRRCPRRSGW